MPVKPDSRFAKLTALQAVAPDGSVRRVISLRLNLSLPEGRLTVHELRQDEDLDSLAQTFYGSESLWWQILDANPILFPLDIQAGEELNIPERGFATRTTRARRF